MKHILLVIDPKETAQHALQRSKMFLRRLLADHDVTLHVVGLGDASEAELEHYAQAICQECDADGHRLSTDIKVQPTVKDVAAYAETIDASLIIAGTSKDTDGGLAPSDIKLMLRETKRPVLVVKRTPLVEYQKVLVSVDFSEPSHRAFMEAVRFIPKAEFYLLHTYDAPFAGFMDEEKSKQELHLTHDASCDDFIAKVTQELREQQGIDDVHLRKLLLAGSVENEVLQAADNVGVQLIALGTRGHNKLTRALLGSVTEAMIERCAYDLLIAH